MNATTVSNFFSRDALLKRQARTTRTRKPVGSQPLHIIPEEDEPRASCSSARSASPMRPYSPSPSPSPSPSALKSKRRHAALSVSDIRIARDAPVHDTTDLTTAAHSSLLSAPRPAPRPPVPSPDSFSLTFTDVAYQFPHPPIPTPTSLLADRYSCVSPTPSMSSSASSPGSESAGLPMTPGSSDDECATRVNSRRVSIKPLVIVKQRNEESPLRPSSLLEQQPCKGSSPTAAAPLSPLLSSSSSSSSSSDDSSSAYDSDPESDSEWYTREFSKILTLCSPLPPASFPTQQNARPESALIAPTPTRAAGPNGQLDPTFPRRKRSMRIPKHAPPPVPPIPAHFRSLSSSSSSPSPSPRRSSAFLAPPTPTSRPDVPRDCCVFDDDACSAFSFSLYVEDEQPGSGRGSKSSASSFYSQGSFEGVYAFPQERALPSPSHPSSARDSAFPQDVYEEEYDLDLGVEGMDVEVDMDYPMMLPLSLPSSPIDLEKDIQCGLEELRRGEVMSVTEQILALGEKELDTVQEEEEVEEAQPEQKEESKPLPLPLPIQENDLFSPLTPSFPLSPAPYSPFPTSSYYSSSPTPSSFSFSSTSSSVSPSHPSSSPKKQAPKHTFSHSPYPPRPAPPPLDRQLKSKWSSSTLGSIHEEHAQQQGGAKGKLRLWGGGSPSKRVFSSSAKKSLPPTPLSPSSPSSSRGMTHDSVMIIGYGHGLRRSTSVTSGSDAGSECSSASGGSVGSGLRRKPIPVEMFLRSAC